MTERRRLFDAGPGRGVRRVVLRDTCDEMGSMREEASLEEDGTLRFLGHDRGQRVTLAFGASVTSYEWTYVVPPDRIGQLTRALGGSPGDDVLALLATYHRRVGGTMDGVFRSPGVRAEFSNWHS
jgi:hypothetical protein